MGGDTERDRLPDDVSEEMDVLDPYTTREIAAVLDPPAQHVRDLLDRLARPGTLRTREPEPGRAIRIREPPASECPDCGDRYEVEPLHPVLSVARVRPSGGTQL